VIRIDSEHRKGGSDTFPNGTQKRWQVTRRNKKKQEETRRNKKKQEKKQCE
jgi:hypothetical protein